MTKKINFLEKDKYVLTYRKMVMIIVVWILLCFSFFLVENGYKWVVGKGVEKQKKVLAKLNARKNEAMTLIEAAQVRHEEPEVKKLSEVFERFPYWSRVMKAISECMPSRVWLTSLTSSYTGNSMYRRVEISGEAYNTALIASFARDLNEKGGFQNVVMNKSVKAGGEGKFGYSFVLLGEVVFEAKEWD